MEILLVIGVLAIVLLVIMIKILLILWKLISRLVYKKEAIGNSNYFNLIGQLVTVIDKPLKPGCIGKVLWSGIIMNAMMEEKEQDQVPVNSVLYVIRVKGNILTCSQKAPF